MLFSTCLLLLVDTLDRLSALHHTWTFEILHPEKFLRIGPAPKIFGLEPPVLRRLASRGDATLYQITVDICSTLRIIASHSSPKSHCHCVRRKRRGAALRLLCVIASVTWCWPRVRAVVARPLCVCVRGIDAVLVLSSTCLGFALSHCFSVHRREGGPRREANR